MGRKKNATKNIIWGLINKSVMVFAPFLSRTVLIYTLGIEYEGIKGLFTSLLGVLSFAELGISSAIVFSMYRPAAENDDVKICAWLNLYKIAYRVIGCIITVAGLILLPFLPNLIKQGTPTDINIYLLYLIYLFNSVVGYFLYPYSSAIFTAFQKTSVLSKVNTFIQLSLYVFQIAALLITRNYYAYVVVFPITTIASNLIIAYLANKYYPQYSCRGKIYKEDANKVVKNIGGLIFQKIGSIVLSSVDSIVISAFLGLRILGIYNGYFCIITALLSLLMGIQQAIIPSIGNSIIQKSVEENYHDMKTYDFLYTWIIVWCCTCLFCLYQPFMYLWQGADNMLSSSMVTLFTIFFFIHHIADISYIYKEAVGLWWQGKFIPIISSIINLAMNIILVQIIGLPGILISTIVSLGLINNVFGSYVIFKNYYKSISKWIKYMLGMVFYSLKALIVVLLSSVVCNLICGQNITTILLKLIICCFVSNVAWLLLNIRNSNMHNALMLLAHLKQLVR